MFMVDQDVKTIMLKIASANQKYTDREKKQFAGMFDRMQVDE